MPNTRDGSSEEDADQRVAGMVNQLVQSLDTVDVDGLRDRFRDTFRESQRLTGDVRAKTFMTSVQRRPRLCDFLNWNIKKLVSRQGLQHVNHLKKHDMSTIELYGHFGRDGIQAPKFLKIVRQMFIDSHADLPIILDELATAQKLRRQGRIQVKGVDGSKEWTAWDAAQAFAATQLSSDDGGASSDGNESDEAARDGVESERAGSEGAQSELAQGELVGDDIEVGRGVRSALHRVSEDGSEFQLPDVTFTSVHETELPPLPHDRTPPPLAEESKQAMKKRHEGEDVMVNQASIQEEAGKEHGKTLENGATSGAQHTSAPRAGADFSGDPSLKRLSVALEDEHDRPCPKRACLALPAPPAALSQEVALAVVIRDGTPDSIAHIDTGDDQDPDGAIRRALQSLQPGQLVNATAIGLFLSTINLDPAHINVFESGYLSTTDPTAVVRRHDMRRFNKHKWHRLLFPLHHPSRAAGGIDHWTLGVVDTVARQYAIYDPSPSQAWRSSSVQAVKALLPRLGHASADEWDLQPVDPRIPSCPNNTDCGVFVMLAAMTVLLDIPGPVLSAPTPVYRQFFRSIISSDDVAPTPPAIAHDIDASLRSSLSADQCLSTLADAGDRTRLLAPSSALRPLVISHAIIKRIRYDCKQTASLLELIDRHVEQAESRHDARPVLTLRSAQEHLESLQAIEAAWSQPLQTVRDDIANRLAAAQSMEDLGERLTSIKRGQACLRMMITALETHADQRMEENIRAINTLRESMISDLRLMDSMVHE